MNRQLVTVTACGDYFEFVYCEPVSAALRVDLMDVRTMGEAERVVHDGVSKVCQSAALEWIGSTNRRTAAVLV